MVGIIAEYNPFHKGHKYHIEQAKKISGEEHAVVIMSGDYVQRGEPAIVDKYTRVQMALAEGADYVFEMPLKYVLSSAEKFAYGGVLALCQLGAVNSICFGSEQADLGMLQEAADFFAKEPSVYRQQLTQYLQEGKSFPAAREQAYRDVNCLDEKTHEELFLPNNILGIEYLKAIRRLNATIRPFCIQREGAGYHEETLEAEFVSATAIRKRMTQGEIVGVSEVAEQILEQAIGMVFPEDFYDVVCYAIRERWEQLSRYQDVSEELANRIQKAWDKSTSWEILCDNIKGKNFTMSRVKRVLFQILLGIEKEELSDSMPYLRLLGMKGSCKESLRTKCPILGGLAKDGQNLVGAAKEELECEIRAADWYRMIQQRKTGVFRTNEYQTPVIRM